MRSPSLVLKENLEVTYLSDLAPKKTPSEKRSIREIVAQAFDSLAKSYVAKFYEKYQPVEIFLYVKQAFDSAYEIADRFSKTVHAVCETTKNLCKSQKIVNGIFNCTYFTSVLSAPFAVHKIYKCALKIFKNSTVMQKVDAGLAMAVSFSGLTEGTTYIAEGLAKFGVVAGEALKWTAGVTIASVALSSAAVFANIRGWYKTHRFLKKAATQFGTTSEEHKTAINFMVSNKKSEKFLKAKPEQLEKIKTYAENETSKNQLESLYEKLHSRIKTKIFSHKVAIVVAVIGLIASTILLAATPLAPIAYIIMGIGAMILIGKYVNDRIDQRNFDKWVKELTITSPDRPTLTIHETPPRRKRTTLIDTNDETFLRFDKSHEIPPRRKRNALGDAKNYEAPIAVTIQRKFANAGVVA